MDFVRDNLLLVLVALVSGGWLLWSVIGRKLSGARELGVVDAVLKMNHEDAIVLDVREPAEWSQGHIPNARHIPLGELERRAAELEKFKDKPIIVACRSGHRSAAACRILSKRGFGQTYNLSGGMIAWEQANLPVEK